MNTCVANSQDLIDSRDIIARIEELEEERAELEADVESAKETFKDAQDDTSALSTEDKADAEEGVTDAADALADWDASENAEELRALQGLADEGICSWNDGATLIRDSYFQEFAEGFAEDIGAIDKNVGWPLTCIDWEKAAEELQQDYSSVDYDGVDYWYRS